MNILKRTVLLLAPLWLLNSLALGQTETTFVNKVEQLQFAFDDVAALQVTEEGLKLYPASLMLNAQASFLNTSLGINENEKKRQATYIQRADALANNLLKTHPTQSIAYTAKATALGAMAITQSNKRKIDIAYAIKANIDKALQMDNTSAIAWHVLGRWSYEMASLSKTERFFAGLIYRPIPQSSMEDAVKFLYKSYTLKKDFAPNHLFLSLAYKKLGNLQESNRFKKEGANLVPQVTNDIKIIEQLKNL